MFVRWIFDEILRTYTSVGRTSSNILACWVESAAHNFTLHGHISHACLSPPKKLQTECAPARLTMGASRLLVLCTVRISPLFLSSFDDEIAIWLDGGGVALARFTRAPPGVGEGPLFDM